MHERILAKFLHLDHADPQRAARAPQESLCTSATPIPKVCVRTARIANKKHIFLHTDRRSAEGRAGKLEIAKTLIFCTSTAPIPAAGRMRTVRIEQKILSFCTPTTPILSEGRGGMLKIAKPSVFASFSQSALVPTVPPEGANLKKACKFPRASYARARSNAGSYCPCLLSMCAPLCISLCTFPTCIALSTVPVRATMHFPVHSVHASMRFAVYFPASTRITLNFPYACLYVFHGLLPLRSSLSTFPMQLSCAERNDVYFTYAVHCLLYPPQMRTHQCPFSGVASASSDEQAWCRTLKSLSCQLLLHVTLCFDAPAHEATRDVAHDAAQA